MLASGMKTIPSLVGVRPRDHQHYREIPIFGRLLDDFVPWAFGRGYTIHTVYLQLDSVRRLGTWFSKRGRRSARALTADDMAAAHRCFIRRRPDPRYAWGMRGFVAFLSERGLLKPGHRKPSDRCDREAARFLEYLRRDCGTAESTCESHRRRVVHFLRFLGFKGDGSALKSLTLASVHRYVRSVSGRCARKTMQHVVGTLRSFLRFQFMRGAISRPLHDQIDTVRTSQDGHLPYPVQWKELQKLLRRIDRSTPLGLRDYGVLLVAATYGLRGSDVANLSLDDIDWRKRTISIVQCKTRQPLSLPLTDEVGAALAAYIRKARPATECRRVFLRWRAPVAPLSLPGMCNTLRRASQTAGLSLKAAGFRCLRHAFAMRLLRQGATTKAIGDILGHRSPHSTSAYLRLDVDDLRTVALPVPCVGKDKEPRRRATAEPSSRPRVVGRVAPTGWGWRSTLGKPMADYLALQRALGRDYEMPEGTLRGLDFFLVHRRPPGTTLCASLFEEWASGLRQLSPTTARMRMLCVRKFCLHLSRSRPGMFIPDMRAFPREVPHQAPCLLSGTEVARILEATAMLRSSRSNPLHPETIRLALLMTYCCGLRLGEILKLRLEDIDTTEMVLRIIETKFHKSRLVPLSSSVADEARRYLVERRLNGMPMEPGDPLVWNGWPRRNGTAAALTVTPFWATWRRVCRHAQVFDHRGLPPRLHDLRHSFAVEALLRGYRADQDAQAVLPRLAHYMGHSGILFTHYYLKFTEPLRCVAGERFRRHLTAAVLKPLGTGEGGEP